MKVLLGLQDLWKFMENGYAELASPTIEANLSAIQKNTLKEFRKRDKKVLFLIYQGVTESNVLEYFQYFVSTKVWEILQKSYQGI